MNVAKNLYCLVIGVEGFLGSNVCSQLLERGEHVRAFELRNNHAISETTVILLRITKGEMQIDMQGSLNLYDVRDLAYGCIAKMDKGAVLPGTLDIYE